MNIDLWLEKAIKKIKSTDLDEMIKQLESFGLVQPATKWIKCVERMPESGIRVIVFNGEDVQICFREWDGIRYFWEERNYSIVIPKITHWQPLPPPPEDN